MKIRSPYRMGRADSLPQRCKDVIIPAMAIRLSSHAEFEIARRGLDRESVLEVASDPEQEIRLSGSRHIRQSRIAMEQGKIYLLRVIVETGEGGQVVVTAYRTSKIAKYWSHK